MSSKSPGTLYHAGFVAVVAFIIISTLVIMPEGSIIGRVLDTSLNNNSIQSRVYIDPDLPLATVDGYFIPMGIVIDRSVNNMTLNFTFVSNGSQMITNWTQPRVFKYFNNENQQADISLLLPLLQHPPILLPGENGTYLITVNIPDISGIGVYQLEVNLSNENHSYRNTLTELFFFDKRPMVPIELVEATRYTLEWKWDFPEYPGVKHFQVTVTSDYGTFTVNTKKTTLKAVDLQPGTKYHIEVIPIYLDDQSFGFAELESWTLPFGSPTTPDNKRPSRKPAIKKLPHIDDHAPRNFSNITRPPIDPERVTLDNFQGDRDQEKVYFVETPYSMELDAPVEEEPEEEFPIIFLFVFVLLGLLLLIHLLAKPAAFGNRITHEFINPLEINLHGMIGGINPLDTQQIIQEIDTDPLILVDEFTLDVDGDIYDSAHADQVHKDLSLHLFKSDMKRYANGFTHVKLRFNIMVKEFPITVPPGSAVLVNEKNFNIPMKLTRSADTSSYLLTFDAPETGEYFLKFAIDKTEFIKYKHVVNLKIRVH